VWNASDGAGLSEGSRRSWYTGGAKTVWSSRGEGWGCDPGSRGARRPARQGRMFSASSLFLLGGELVSRLCVAPPSGAAPRPGREQTLASRIQFPGQIIPIRVEFFNELDLPGSPPALHRMFPRARFENGIERLEVDEQIDAIFPGESGNELYLCAPTSAARDCW
jgi:hypothetical protein